MKLRLALPVLKLLAAGCVACSVHTSTLTPATTPPTTVQVGVLLVKLTGVAVLSDVTVTLSVPPTVTRGAVPNVKVGAPMPMPKLWLAVAAR